MESFLLRQMLYRKIMVRLHFIKNVLYLFIYCMSARIVFSISGIILSSWQFFLKKWNPFVKSKCHGEKMIMRPNLIKECIALFSQIIFSFARILLLIWRNIKQHVPSIQIFLLSRNFQCAWSLHLFDNNTKCQSHTACCVGIWYFERHTVWLKAGYIFL